MWDVLVTNEQPEKYFIQQESLSTSFLLLADKLSPEERAVYLLSEIFDYSFKEIGTFLDKSDGACRKMAERARKAIESEKSFPIQNAKAKKLVSDFFAMAKAGDTEGLLKLLDQQSEFWGDGGGKAPVFSSTVMKSADWIVETFRKLGAAPVFGTYKLTYSLINSEPGVLISKIDENGKEKLETLFTFEFRDDKIYKIFAQRNPDKFPTLD
jgi:RNA polymerase sigma-70 factor (ECF subfamily)